MIFISAEIPNTNFSYILFVSLYHFCVKNHGFCSGLVAEMVICYLAPLAGRSRV